MKQTFGDNEPDKRVFSDVLRAGQRTYFFDVKVNRNNQCYLVLTESKKRIDREGNQLFDKHKIHVYHENVEAFSELLNKMRDYLLANNPSLPSSDDEESES